MDNPHEERQVVLLERIIKNVDKCNEAVMEMNHSLQVSVSRECERERERERLGGAGWMCGGGQRSRAENKKNEGVVPPAFPRYKTNRHSSPSAHGDLIPMHLDHRPNSADHLPHRLSPVFVNVPVFPPSRRRSLVTHSRSFPPNRKSSKPT